MHRSFIGFFTFAVVSGLTACAIDGTDDSAAADEPTAEIASASTGNCTYTFVRDSITVIKGEGGFDPALELDVDTTALTSTVNYNGTIKVGATYGTDEAMGTVTVASGTVVTLPWDVEATEFDTLSANDHGSGGGSLTFTCSGSGSKTDSDQITLGNGVIDVQVKVTW
jgi:hypothetical protein